MTGPRRSSRTTPKKSYNVDPFKAIYADSDSGSSTSPEPETNEKISDAEITDHEEDEDDEMEEVEEEKADEDGEMEEVEYEEGNDVEENVIESTELRGSKKSNKSNPSSKNNKSNPTSKDTDDLNEAELIARELGDLDFGQPLDDNPATDGQEGSPVNEGIRTRALTTGTRALTHALELYGRKEVRCIFLFGPTDADLQPIFQTKAKWASHEVLPRRGPEGLAKSFYVQEPHREKEQAQTRSWYWSAGGKQAFEVGQVAKELSPEEGRTYLPVATETNVLMGPHDDQKLHSISTGNAINLDQPFGYSEERLGFLLQMGGRVVDAQWVPNEGGKHQYLAIAVEQKDPESEEPQFAPAFSPQKRFPACIQIMSFESDDDGKLNSNVKPRLECVICTDWGDLKQMRWCPVPLTDTVEQDQDIHLGLLAAIWLDGRIRVLDITYPSKFDTRRMPYFIQVSRAAFDVLPQETVATCLTWLSGTSLAIGTASGSVEIWSLHKKGVFPTPRDGAAKVDFSYEPKPWFNKTVAGSYIVTITSGFPSRPQFICTTSVDGHSRMIDLRAPRVDAGFSHRMRLYGHTGAWHEQTQCFMLPDDNHMMQSHIYRRYYLTMNTIRLDSQILSCATSPVHPLVLVGCVDGSVTLGNPINRVLINKKEPIQLTWFQHEWRRPIESSSVPLMPDPAQTPLPPDIPASVVKGAMMRIQEGFEPRPVFIQNQLQGIVQPNITAIFEEGSAVTCLAWNPNRRCGTWAVAGMGSGLVRVEDLGVDAGEVEED